ncbi:adenine deaminase [bacterium]|nr:adenine deaminase [bacterium]
MNKISGNIVDVVKRKIFKGTVSWQNGIISQIEAHDTEAEHYILPGLVDAHIHIESSMLIPSEFARMAVVHGTVATVSDPHEIANVLGNQGVDFMIANGKTVPFHFHFGAPSCVPATAFETAGAHIGPDEIAELMANPDIYYLAEMMNYPGVLFSDEEVMKKLQIAKKSGKPIDGHAPGLRGENARKYIAAGISTDHECYTLPEALEKLGYGMKIIIREGSAAKNFEALVDLYDEHAENIMLCSDDKHPDDLIKGHINQLILRAFAKGKDKMDVLRSCTVNPVLHYGMRNGLLRAGDSADMIVVDSLETFNVMQTYVAGKLVAENGKSFIETQPVEPLNYFNCEKIDPACLGLSLDAGTVRTIKILDKQIVTEEINYEHKGGNFEADLANDVLKIIVVNRYQNAAVAMALVHNSGLKSGAIASSVAHDSHNIIAIGTNYQDLSAAVNAIIETKGGVAAALNGETRLVPLPMAGLMSNEDGQQVAKNYEKLDQWVKNTLGCPLTAPYMTLSFLALLVIPKLKLSDKGLFDGEKFEFVR